MGVWITDRREELVLLAEGLARVDRGFTRLFGPRVPGGSAPPAKRARQGA